MEPVVRLIPLGGLGEIGLNMVLVESGDDLIAIDCGVMFPDDELLGIDLVIPDFYLRPRQADGFRGVVITHGHEDHIGALPYVLREVRVPVYGTPLTLALVTERLREHGLDEQPTSAPCGRATAFEAGPFRVEPIHVTHSIVDGDRARHRHAGRHRSCTPATSRSTTPRSTAKRPTPGASPSSASKACSPSARTRPTSSVLAIRARRRSVGRALGERFARATGRIILSTFSSHIHRMQQVLDLAGARRAPGGAGRAEPESERRGGAPDLGYLRVPAGVLADLEELATTAGRPPGDPHHGQPGRAALGAHPDRDGRPQGAARSSPAIRSSSRRASSPATSARSGT